MRKVIANLLHTPMSFLHSPVVNVIFTIILTFLWRFIRNQTRIFPIGKYNCVMLYLVSLCVVNICPFASIAGTRSFPTQDFIV